MSRTDPRDPMAVGMTWASRVTTLGLEFALPALLGIGLDRWWGTRPVAAIVGSILGFVAGITHVLRLSAAESKPAPDETSRGPGEGP